MTLNVRTYKKTTTAATRPAATTTTSNRARIGSPVVERTAILGDVALAGPALGKCWMRRHPCHAIRRHRHRRSVRLAR